MVVKYFFILLIVVEVLKAAPPTTSNKVNCVQCHYVDPNKLNIHLVPHSHDDVGWLKTYDQYYYGLNSTIQQASVQYIITSVVNALLQNPRRRFIQVETAYFWKWWKDQDLEMRYNFKSLVDNGQIEMVNGAWAMNDEACTNYQSTIDQFTWGLRLLNKTVGICGVPSIGWQIDPFGHSREQASLLSQMGYNGVFFARLDFADKLTRQNNSAVDFVWQGSANLAEKIIFGGTFPTSIYNPPNGFCWDILCNDDPLVDNTESPDYNIETKVKEFTKLMLQYKSYYRTNNILIPMGSDFQFSAAEANYINMDRLIKAYINHPELNVIYSTPSCYLQAVYDARPNLPLKTDDFFPYSNDDHSYWAGYFTSRPNSKRFERMGHNILQVTKQLFAMTKSDKYAQNLEPLREAMGTLQHHDAITGTEKQHVADDYVRLLSNGIKKAEKPLAGVIKKLLDIDDAKIALELSSCLLSNISICSTSQNSDKMIVVVYNPLAWNVSHFVRLPTKNGTFSISGPDGVEEYELVPALSAFDFVKLPNNRPSSHDLVFEARGLPPLGFKTYYIKQTEESKNQLNKAIETSEKTLTFGWTNNNFSIDTTTNLLKSVSLNGISVEVQQNFYYYISATREKNILSFVSGDDDEPQIVSGAYLFRPNGTEPTALKGQVISTNTFDGKFVKEFHQKWLDPEISISQIIRVYKDQDYIEFDWLVGNIDIGDNKTGKEVITKFIVTGLDNNNTFYTDSNGREMIKRIKNYRPDYKYNITAEPVASNYYPVTSKIVIKDENADLEVAVLNDRSQGGTSLEKGEIELMVHRRLFRDDNKGVGEPLNETEFGDVGIYVRGLHYLVLGKAKQSNPNGLTTAAEERILAQKKLLQPWIGIGQTDKSQKEVGLLGKASYSALVQPLPENVNILTFEPWEDQSFILRLEHIFEKNEDPKKSAVTKVNLQQLFKNIPIRSFKETTLGANILLKDYFDKPKYKWQTDGLRMKTIQNDGGDDDESDFVITLTPMQIRTFIVKFDADHSSSDFVLVARSMYVILCILLCTILRL